MTDAATALNRARWNELTAIHARSAFYDLQGFKAGKCGLRPIEVNELSEVRDKSLLHLQCHFGIDTLSWARRGARVTGVDFSEEAIALAHCLSEQVNVPGEFICSDLHSLPDILSRQFDIVFTSYGAICWLRDLKRWAEIIAHYLKRDGTFYMVELHPAAFMLDDAAEATDLRVGYPYFHTVEPIRSESTNTYADREAVVHNTVSYTWNHGMGEIVNALVGAGLRIEFLNEFPYCVCRLLPSMIQGPDGWWRLPGNDQRVPFLFSLKAISDR
jgi:SAM-dependent methyltransferase